MAVRTRGELNTLALTIKNEVAAAANTATRVGGLHEDESDSYAMEADLTADEAALAAHIANLSNPHAVTKTQVGLGNVDNTSDVNKPVSTAQQTALDLKENLSNKDNGALSASTTTYPTSGAVKTAVDLKLSLTAVDAAVAATPAVMANTAKVSWDKTTAVTFAISQFNTDFAVGTNVSVIPMAWACTLTGIALDTGTANTGSTLIVDVNLGYSGVSIMTTSKLVIDIGETSTRTAATPPVLTTTAIAAGDQLWVDIDQKGSTIAGKDGYITLYFTRT